jgi:hypothetical protein
MKFFKTAAFLPARQGIKMLLPENPKRGRHSNLSLLSRRVLL